MCTVRVSKISKHSKKSCRRVEYRSRKDFSRRLLSRRPPGSQLRMLLEQSFVYEPLGLLAEDIRPNGNILCYPVITSGEFAHRGSFNELCRDLIRKNILSSTSLEKQAGTQNPPTFIWHTNEDQAVPVENSFLYTAALRKAKVSVEFHMYAHGWHGLSLANEETKCDKDGELPKVQSGWVCQSRG